jgi:serine/threonine-protein kinase HSL1 (negative regulator of Swe1 kinase)
VSELETGGSLYNLEKLKTKLTEEEAMEYFTMILLGLNHMHSYNIVHRDLKPANIMIN